MLARLKPLLSLTTLRNIIKSLTAQIRILL
nr:MAG TPA: Transcription factor BRX N-terminal domain [Bacteriophage sp.]